MEANGAMDKGTSDKITPIRPGIVGSGGEQHWDLGKTLETDLKVRYVLATKPHSKEDTFKKLKSLLTDSAKEPNSSWGLYSNNPPAAIRKKQRAEDMMSDSNDKVSRSELHAELKAVEARMETMQVKIEGKLDLIVSKLENEVIPIRTEFKNAKWWAIGTALAVFIMLVSVLTYVRSEDTAWMRYVLSNHPTSSVSTEASHSGSRPTP